MKTPPPTTPTPIPPNRRIAVESLSVNDCGGSVADGAIYERIFDMDEIWKPIPEWEDYYEVSNTGKIRSIGRWITPKNGSTTYWKQGKELSPKTSTNGYCGVTLARDGSQVDMHIHRAVALAFVPNPQNLPEVNHDNGIKSCNFDWNLSWTSAKENHIHAYRNELIKTRPIICEQNGIAYRSVSDCAKHLKVTKQAIIGVINGAHKQVFGYTFTEITVQEYLELENGHHQYNGYVTLTGYECKPYMNKKVYDLTKSENRGDKFTKKKLICLETGIEYESTADAARKMKLPQTCISSVCRGKRKSSGGYTFKYIHD